MPYVGTTPDLHENHVICWPTSCEKASTPLACSPRPSPVVSHYLPFRFVQSLFSCVGDPLDEAGSPFTLLPVRSSWQAYNCILTSLDSLPHETIENAVRQSSALCELCSEGQLGERRSKRWTPGDTTRCLCLIFSDLDLGLRSSCIRDPVHYSNLRTIRKSRSLFHIPTFQYLGRFEYRRDNIHSFRTTCYLGARRKCCACHPYAYS